MSIGRRPQRIFPALLMALVLIGSAATAPAQAAKTSTTRHASIADPHSFSRPTEVGVKHLTLDVVVDFAQKRVTGRATLLLDNLTGARELHLDTYDLVIEKVTLGDDEKLAQFRLGSPVPYLGSDLTVKIQPDNNVVNVYYRTKPDAVALQWLSPEQTAGKKRPFLFTQSEAILARSWVPLQDSPGVRFTYDATVRVPRDLMAVMSAENPTKRTDDGVYRFRMPNPIPAYLLALAVGDLEFRPLSPSAGVYAEVPVVEAAAWELADTAKMIDQAEKLYGPYRWGRYDDVECSSESPDALRCRFKTSAGVSCRTGRVRRKCESPRDEARGLRF